MGGPNYNKLSSEYGRRYDKNPLPGVEERLRRIVVRVAPRVALEVGCGTGRWLPTLASGGARVVGIDPFLGMLLHGRGAARLVCADGDLLPLAPSSFDLVTLVNAVHHLQDPGAFLEVAFRLLRPAGEIALVHYDPSRSGQDWYVYDYFDGTRTGDLDRFPRAAHIARWLHFAGFEEPETSVAEVIERAYSGEEVLEDYFLGHTSNSTLARLTRPEYERGLTNLRRALAYEDERGGHLDLAVRLELLLLTARKPAG